MGACALAAAALFTAPTPAWARTTQSITDTRVAWPTLSDLISVITLQGYNTRLVVLSTAMLGLAAGVIGSFLLLRKRSLMGDVLSHATLPGIAAAFMVMVAWGGGGKSLPGLLAGATVFALLGVGCVQLMDRHTRLKDDTAMGIVLSVYFGLGIALMGIVQSMPGGNKAGLESFIYGKTASMVFNDFVLIAGVACACSAVCLTFFKEFKLLCFDDGFAQSQGWPVHTLDLLMLILVTCVTVIGLQAVGLILVIALLITPPAAARFWTEDLRKLMAVSAVVGALSGWLGASVSALVPRMPAGAIIVIVAAALFVLSMVFGTARGVLVRARRRRRLDRRIARQHLLRAMFELNEQAPASHTGQTTTQRDASVTFRQLLAARSWNTRALKRLLNRARRAELIQPTPAGAYTLTEQGAAEAARHVRNHRLWEIYLITRADIAPNHVDRDADEVEHVLGTDMVAQLEQLVKLPLPKRAVPASPHG